MQQTGVEPEHNLRQVADTQGRQMLSGIGAVAHRIELLSGIFGQHRLHMTQRQDSCLHLSLSLTKMTSPPVPPIESMLSPHLSLSPSLPLILTDQGDWEQKQ